MFNVFNGWTKVQGDNRGKSNVAAKWVPFKKKSQVYYIRIVTDKHHHLEVKTSVSYYKETGFSSEIEPILRTLGTPNQKTKK